MKSPIPLIGASLVLCAFSAQAQDKRVTPPTVPNPIPGNSHKVTRVDFHDNNGWGNGDQDAPGNSGPHNNAENGPGDPPPGNPGSNNGGNNSGNNGWGNGDQSPPGSSADNNNAENGPNSPTPNSDEIVARRVK